MPHIKANGLDLFYDEHGAADAPPMLLVMGLGAQMTLWPIEFVEALAMRGFRVIRFDNRDIGLSQKMEEAKTPSILRMLVSDLTGLPLKTPYTLTDMADDTAGVIDTLGLSNVHLVGASMGGMISQLVAHRHGDKLASLTSIMSSSGHRKLPRAERDAMRVMVKRPKSQEEADLIEHGMRIARTIGSPAFPAEEERLRERITMNVRRSAYPAGYLRQLAAIMADGDRRERLQQITLPTLVLHGEDDPLVPAEHGKDTVAHIPGAQIKTYPGMGHDLPQELIDTMADAIAEHAYRAEGSREAA